MSGSYPILYKLEYHGNSFEYRFELDRHGLLTNPSQEHNSPEWTHLAFNKCHHCPYRVGDIPNCPVAVNLAKFVADWRNVTSFEELELTVITPVRTVVSHTNLQTALRSAVGLVISGSDCEHTRFFRLMARMHLPLATSEETVTRAVSIYLLHQFLVHQKNGSAVVDLTGLHQIYDNISILNLALANRLRALESKDGIINAIVSLDSFSQTIVFSIDDSLSALKKMFDL